MLPDYDNNELHDIQKEIGLGLNDIIMMYNRLMLMLIGFFSAINLYRDGKLAIGILVFIVASEGLSGLILIDTFIPTGIFL